MLVADRVGSRGNPAAAPVRAADAKGRELYAQPHLALGWNLFQHGRVIFRDDGMVLSLQGRALGDAAVGEAVQVLNLGSKKTVEAVASGPGRALVGPEADAIRVAPARAAPSLYASVR